ncbi:MAG: oligosaccharide flippase family protein [Gemmatimonadota bacterium]|nr:oligosaccharide flippase family protein [Gemmatimonadota bacterium]
MVKSALAGQRGSRLSQLQELLRTEGLASTLARGTLWAFAINAFGTALSFAAQVLLARTSGQLQYGTYAYTLGWMNIVLLLAKFEFDGSAVRFLGAYHGQKAWSLLRGFLRRSAQWVTMLSLAVAAIAVVLLWIFRSSLPSTLAASFLIATALLPLTALLQLTSSSLQGLRRVVAAQAPTMVVRPLFFAGSILVVTQLLGRPMDAATAVGINCVTTAIVLVISVKLLRDAIPADVRSVRAEYDTREWWRVAAGLLVISTSQLILSQQADVVVVGTLVGKTAAGHYGAASQLATLVHFGVTAVLFMATPMIADYHARGQRADVQQLATLVGRVNLILATPVLAALAVGGTFALRLFGPSFVDAYPVLLVLGSSQMVLAIVGSLAGYLLSMTGHQKQAAVIIGGSAVLNLVLTLILTPRFGMIGTASATLTSVITRSIALTIYIRRILAVDPLPFRFLTSRAR